MALNSLDIQILQSLQYDFTLSKNPYDIIADELKLSPDELLDRINNLVSAGIIRRMGFSFYSHKLGFSSTIAAVMVEPARVAAAAEVINKFHEVTHNYLRSGKFNIWFTIIALTQDRIDRILDQIRSELSLQSSQVLNLPAKRFFKLDSRFNLAT
jgi:DNA-binding Lrp family transcriptional regulator